MTSPFRFSHTAAQRQSDDFWTRLMVRIVTVGIVAGAVGLIWNWSAM